MTKTNNIIELNGKRYDAKTGAFLGVKAQPTGIPTVVKPIPPARANQRGTVMDGVAAKPTTAKVHMPVKKAPASRHNISAKPIAPHKPEHAKTLMRHAVKPPTVKPKTAVKLQTPTDLVKKQPAVMSVAPKLSSQVVDLKRFARAENVPRSGKIERFRQAPQPRRTGTVHTNLTNVQPIRPNQARSTGGFSPAKTHNFAQPQPAIQSRPQVAAAQRTPSTDIFERALAQATSHEAPRHDKRAHKTKRGGRKHTRFAGVMASILVVLALGGFFAYQNRASMQLQLASARAGFHASLPGYKPAGFAFKRLNYSPGVVTVGYQHDTSAFNVIQKASNWNSETLLENVVATSGEPYQAYQAAGRTIYIYENGGATWVNGGVWYQVNGNANLGKDQLINLATSI